VFDLEIVAPVTVLASVADCTRVRLEAEWPGQGGSGCEFTGLVLSHQDTNLAVVPYFIASSKVVDPPSGLTILSSDLTVDLNTADQCGCPECCDGLQDLYELDVTVAGIAVTVAATEAQTTMVVATEYQVGNLQSHEAGVCGAPPAVDWVIADLAFLP
jgi:hypothetical protein